VKSLSGKDFARLVEQHDWQLLHIHGSQHIYGKSGNPGRLSIPIHGTQPLKRGLLAHLAKQAGLSEEDLA
jgi:predicted RNA binding protein YcfA (HicA-like mRNA interferase family)